MAHSRTGRRGMPLESVMIAVLEILRAAGNDGRSKTDLVKAIGATSAPTVQRALDRLRSSRDAPIETFGSPRRWRLRGTFGLPLDAPEREDIVAVLIAEAIVRPFGNDDVSDRIARLGEELDARLRARAAVDAIATVGPARARATSPAAALPDHDGFPPRAALTATLTLGTRVDPEILRTLLAACRRKVLRMRYFSPWSDAAKARQQVRVEPWALRVHDGAAYLRAWCRDAGANGKGAARTYRVAQIEAVTEIPRDTPRRRLPAAGKIWGAEHQAYGIDDDRPGTAVLRLRGGVARWLSRVTWHPRQHDRWVVAGDLLERRLPYRSCREMARRVLSVIDGVEAIEPPALREQVSAYVRSWTG